MDQTSILKYIHSSAEKVAESAIHCEICQDGITAFLNGLDLDKLHRVSPYVSYPLKFKDLADHVNLVALNCLLAFGSGYRKELHSACGGKGASQSILYGIIGAFLSYDSLNANWMANISIAEVSSVFGIPMDEEKVVQTGVYLSQDGPLKPLVKHIHKVLNETGTKLQDLGHFSLGEMIISHLKGDSSADGLVVLLSKSFPAFNDRSGEIYFMKKAQLLAAELNSRFKTEHSIFDFPDIHLLSIFVDNVIPCVLNEVGILKYSPELTTKIKERIEIKSGSTEEIEIRACAIVACDILVKRIAITLPTICTRDFDVYLWKEGKNARFRPLERHVTKDTIFY